MPVQISLAVYCCSIQSKGLKKLTLLHKLYCRKLSTLLDHSGSFLDLLGVQRKYYFSDSPNFVNLDVLGQSQNLACGLLFSCVQVVCLLKLTLQEGCNCLSSYVGL